MALFHQDDLWNHSKKQKIKCFVFRQKTKLLWSKQFPDEPFDLDKSKGKGPQEFPNGLVSKIGYNIEEAAIRQRDFFYQVKEDLIRVQQPD